jgi:NAD(P)H-hydrate epimerase
MTKQERLFSSRQAKEFDLRVREKLGLSTLALMENAGRAVSEEVLRFVKGKTNNVAIFCGKGNNGGDGFCAARHLLARGLYPDIYLAGCASEVRGEAEVNLKALLKLKQKIIELDVGNLGLLRARVSHYHVIVDALFGVGLKGLVRGISCAVIPLLNASGAHILAVDIPSGLDADTGKVLGCCVRADTTLTFVAKKLGMVRGSGPEHCGKIKVDSLGIPCS